MGLFKCYKCSRPTDRFITFFTERGVVDAFECADCRQERVRAQVDAGLRPPEDLLPENFPEVRNPYVATCNQQQSRTENASRF